MPTASYPKVSVICQSFFFFFNKINQQKSLNISGSIRKTLTFKRNTLNERTLKPYKMNQLKTNNTTCCTLTTSITCLACMSSMTFSYSRKPCQRPSITADKKTRRNPAAPGSHEQIQSMLTMAVQTMTLKVIVGCARVIEFGEHDHISLCSED